MQIEINDPVTQTYLFSIVFFLALFLSIRRKEQVLSFTKEVTEDLKGFGILAVVFSHIGYFLSTDDKFLFPLSILAGVGVNLFLFVSGFGLTISALSKPLSIFGFYKKRLLKLFVPMWTAITVLVFADYVFFGQTFDGLTLIQNYLGFFPRADIFTDLDSPLWYFSLILFFYLIFPLFFWRKFPFFSAPLLILAAFLIFRLPLPIDEDVVNLYKLHFLSFPLGVFFAQFISHEELGPVKSAVKTFFTRFKLKYIFAPLFLLVFFETSFNSGVGLGKLIEQTISLITMFSIIFLFLMSGFRFALFGLIGKYSYEIYLIHWPILSRYGFLYLYLPPFLATWVYLGVFVWIGMLMQKINQLRLPRRFAPRNDV